MKFKVSYWKGFYFLEFRKHWWNEWTFIYNHDNLDYVVLFMNKYKDKL